jgi:hypothetical protein
MAASTRFTSEIRSLRGEAALRAGRKQAAKTTGGQDQMKARTLISAACALCLSAGTALAREPGTPAAMPGGATSAVPVGANPPSGLYFSSRTDLSFGDIYDGSGNKLPVSVDVKATALQFHWVPGNEILGGTYRAMILIPIVDLSVAGTGTTGVGDITVSPINVSWMLAPGVFIQTGLSLGVPTGEYLGLGQANLGNNVLTTGLDVGFSYLRDGWNLSLHANYFSYGTNDANGFRSGDELLINWTAMKAISADQSLGLVGYFRKQLEDDRLAGAVFGDGNRSEALSIGLGYSKRFGPSELNVNLMHDVTAKNEAGGTKLQINFTTPVKF